jgi:hypothetical protein
MLQLSLVSHEDEEVWALPNLGARLAAVLALLVQKYKY